MKIKTNTKDTKLMIILLIVMLFSALFLYSFKNHFETKTKSEAKLNYNIFIEEVNSKITHKYNLIKEGIYEDNLEVIEINNNLLISKSDLQNIGIYKLNELLINNTNKDPYLVYYYGEKLFIEPIFNLYNSKDKQYFIVTSDLESVIPLGINRNVFDKNIIANIDNNFYQLKDDKLLITIDYNNDIDVYFAQMSEQPFINEITIINHALLVTTTLFAVLFIYSFYYHRKKVLVNLFESFVENYENFYYVLTNKNNEIINSNIPNDIIENFCNVVKSNNNSSFFITIDETKFHFKKFKYNNDYLYFGEGYSSIINSQRNKLYRHLISNLPNYNQLLIELAKFDQNQNEVLAIVSIKNFVNMINNAQLVNEKVITVIKKYFQTNFNYPYIKLYHLRNDIYILTIKRDEITDEMVDSIKSHLSKLTNKLIEALNIGVEFNLALIKANKKLIEGEIPLSSIIGKLLDQGQYSDVVYYDEKIKNDLILTEQVKNDLLKAILEDQFVLYLQPIINIQTNEIIKYEALLRWNNEKYINISPSKYIKIAEDNDLIYDLGYLVIEKTVQIAKQLKGTNKSINMNVSPREFENRGFVDKLFNELKKHDVDSKMISIEITETSLIEPKKQTLENIKKIKKAGIDVFLDDFGTGYSSLLNLRDFPVDYIKIDRSFIKNILDSDIDRKITAGLITLAHNLNMKVIAEGVEYKNQAMLLKDMGCCFAQGYYYSKPVIVDEIIK